MVFTVVKQLEQLQRKSRKISEASMGFESMTSALLYQLSYEAHWEQVKSEFSLYPLYEESLMMCI